MSEQLFIVPQHQCEHGQLARVCNVCELQARVKELEAQLEESQRHRRLLIEKDLAFKAATAIQSDFNRVKAQRDELAQHIRALVCHRDTVASTGVSTAAIKMLLAKIEAEQAK